MKPTPLKDLIPHSSSVLITGGAIDSRLICPGDLFFALPGQKADGHTFLADAAAKGAAAAVVSKEYTGPNFSLPLVYVEDVLETLQEMGRQLLKKNGARVVGITGSLGKTTTKNFATTLLKSRYKVFASPLSYNTQSTVPLSILLAEGDEEIVVLEMGMSEPGQIKKLVSIAPPDVAIVTTVALQHVDLFPEGKEAIKREKKEIFAHPKTEVRIVDHAWWEGEELSFSLEDKAATFYLDENLLYFRQKKVATFDLSFPSLPFYHNFLGAVAIAHVCGVSWKEMEEGSRHLQLPPMRYERIERQGIIFINDAYNANPDAMKAALQSLPKPDPGKKTIAVLSEMNALGNFSEEGHALVAKTALQYTDLLLCLGPKCALMREIWEQEARSVCLFEDKEALGAHLKNIVEEGDVVLLKGARQHALDQILKLFH